MSDTSTGPGSHYGIGSQRAGAGTVGFRSRRRGGLVATALLLVLAGCGKSGGDTAGSGAGDGIGNLSLISHTPANNAVQVPVDTTIELRFDSSIDEGAMTTSEMTLFDTEGNDLPGTFEAKNARKHIIFTPASPLEKASDYRFVVQPTLCDSSFRTLDQEINFGFRTFDDVPPKVAASSIADRATNVVRKPMVAVDFDEAILAESVSTGTVTLRDTWGDSYPLSLGVSGKRVTIVSIIDLPGSSSYVLTLRGGQSGIADRAGNRLAANHVLRFTTAADSTPPSLVESDPPHNAIGVSPKARFEVRFDESMDLGSYEPTGLTFKDAYLNDVPFQLTASLDRRSVYLEPNNALVAGRDYTIHFASGILGLADMSGNSIATAFDRKFRCGSDTSGPLLASSSPAGGASKVSPNVQFELYFNETLKTRSVHPGSVQLYQGSTRVPATVALSGGATRILVTPQASLAQSTTYTLKILSGYDGIQDSAGNPLASTAELVFTTSSSSLLPRFRASPSDGATAIAVSSRISVISDRALDPTTVSSSTVKVKDGDGDTVPGSVSVERGNRVIIFKPSGSLPSSDRITLTLVGGPSGVRETSGNWTTRDYAVSFTTGIHSDVIAPEFDLALNDIVKTRTKGLSVPPHGFTFDINAYDAGGPTVDLASLDLRLSGPGSVPSPDELFAGVQVWSNGKASVSVLQSNALAPGDYSLTVRLADTSGNQATPRSLAFTVSPWSNESRPFERTQIVWARFDIDRDGGGGKGNGVADFEEDMLNHGLIAAGDPLGTNARMIALVRDGAIGVTNKIFERLANGARKSGSVNLRLVTRRPCSAPHMLMAIGGTDPNGKEKRKYGDKSTGVLGRALFDYRNSVPNENNTGTSPGLGVFVGELFLYQSRLYLDLYPHHITTFGRTYRTLSPHMGGTPAGKHTLDSKVLAKGFDYAKASPNERARYDTIMDAADDLAASIGVVLAHEIGHSIGLVAEGEPSGGLHGDSSLHNRTASLTDVMGAVIGYESLVSMQFAFRPLNLAYLRERILVK